MRSSPRRRHRWPLLSGLLLALLLLLPTRAQPPAPDAALPEEARSALENFLLSQDEPQPVQIPFPISQVFLPFVATDQEFVGPPPPPAQADIAVTIRPDPSIRVARASDLVYNIWVRNFGNGVAEEVRVTLPLDSGQLDLLSFTGVRPGDLVSVDQPDRTVVTFFNIEPGERRAASLLYAVNDSLVDDTVISMRADVAWEGPAGGTTVTNWAPVLVGSFNNESRYVFMAITPDIGPVGTFFNAFSDRFIPGEEVAAWFNTPDGIEPLDRDLAADAFGRVNFSFASAGLAPGSYELVLFGQRSKLTAVQAFGVTVP